MTAPAFARLEADDLDTFELVESEGIVVSVLDLGFAEIREAAEARPDTDGVIDQTAFIGACVVTLSGTIVGTASVTRQAVLDRLKTFLWPGRRPYLVFQQEPYSDVRRIRLRAKSHGAPISRPVTADFVVSWSGPDGVQEAYEEETTTFSASTDVEAGFTFDISFDLVFPESPPVGVTTVTNDGNVNAYPIVRLYGPCTGPKVENQTLGRKIELPSLTIAAGDYIELDTRAKTIFLLGDPDQSVSNFFDFDVSDWWWLVPGDNDLRYYPTTSDPGAAAEITFRPNWL